MLKFFFVICSVLAMPLSYANAAAAVPESQAVRPNESVVLRGFIIGLGGESDLYYVVDEKFGKVYIEHRESDPEMYEAIRNLETQMVIIKGSWIESGELSHDSRPILIVDSLDIAP